MKNSLFKLNVLFCLFMFILCSYFFVCFHFLFLNFFFSVLKMQENAVGINKYGKSFIFLLFLKCD